MGQESREGYGYTSINTTVLDQHRKHGCSSDEYQNSFTHHPSNTTIPVKSKKRHLYIEWPVYEALFTKAELKKVHDRFGHPTLKSLMNLLKRARPEESNAKTRKALEDLEARCKQCQTFAPKPFLYKVSIPRKIRTCKKSAYRVLARAPLHLTRK